MNNLIQNKRVGEINYNKNGEEMTIIEYNNCSDILVKFTDGHIVHAQYGNFKRGGVKNANDILTRTGEISFNKSNKKMQIIKYNNYKDIIIEFDDGFIIKSTYQQFKNGEVANPYDKSICDIGYIGEGIYVVKNKNKITDQYIAWSSMMNRCYSEKYHEKYMTYLNCTVCDEWHNFQNFAKWYDENYYSIKDEKMHLDKDILFKGNKIYSPDTCVFVPKNINQLFLKSDKSRGEYPIGVDLIKDRGRFEARCNCNDGTREHLGYYNDPKSAFEAYKVYKENIIKQVADKYKTYIPEKLYIAMYNYVVDIND